MKNYKIEPQGLNEAILHKAVEEGYENRTNSKSHLKASYLFLHDDGTIGYGASYQYSYFNELHHPQISPHEFLRLNWTPKVGEEVECVEAIGSYLIKGKKYIIDSFNKECSIVRIDINGMRDFGLYRFIPIYPKKQLRFKTEQEFIEEFGEGWDEKVKYLWDEAMNYLFGKPANKDNPRGEGQWKFDSWNISDDMLTDKPLPESLGKKIRPVPLDEPDEKPDAYIENVPNSLGLRIVYRHNNEEFVDSDVRNAYQYHLMHPKDYKAKYPDKLMFKNWEVTVGDKAIDVGCKTYLKETVKQYLFIGDELISQGIGFREAYKFLNDNKKTLGL